jgi:VWFA-related protein
MRGSVAAFFTSAPGRSNVIAIRELSPAALGVIFLVAVPAAPEAQVKTAPPIVIEAVQVNVVNVEVFVTGRDGHPITGLGIHDFEVLEDGKAVPITNFFAAAAGRPVAAVGAAVPAAETEGRVEELPEGQTLRLVFFIDNANLTLARRNAIFEHVRSLLKQGLKSGRAQVLLATSSAAVRVRQPFTADEQVLLATLERLEREVGQASVGMDRNPLLTRMMRSAAFPTGEAGSSGRAQSQDFEKQDALSMQQSALSAAEQAYQEARVSLVALTQFVDSLAGVPGRKALVYVSHGVSMRPGELVLKEWEAAYRQYDPLFNATVEANRYTVNREFNELLRRANAGRVTFYCIDGSSSFGGLAVSSEQAAPTADPTATFMDAQSLRESLENMSGATGGRTLTAGPNLVEALARTVEDLQTYYSLGYAAPHDGDGKYHSIDVRVKREEANVRHREGYLDKSADERSVERNLSALVHESASNPLGLAVSVTPEDAQKGDTVAVKVLITIPLGNLVFLPKQESHEGSVSIWLATRDPEDRLSTPVKKSFPVRIPNAQLQTALGQTGSFTFRMIVRKGPQRVAVTMRDELGQIDSTALATFTAGETASGAAGPT